MTECGAKLEVQLGHTLHSLKCTNHDGAWHVAPRGSRWLADDPAMRAHAREYAVKLQALVNTMNERGLIEDGSFTFSDGDTWTADTQLPAAGVGERKDETMGGNAHEADSTTTTVETDDTKTTVEAPASTDGSDDNGSEETTDDADASDGDSGGDAADKE
jgi:hypothetical protein